MFGRRSDGKKVKNIDPFMKIIPHIMYRRTDAMVGQYQDYDAEKIDAYIKDKRETEGVRYNYMHVVLAAFVRVISQRPKINRFIINGRVYRRNNIQVSFAIKKKLIDGAAESTVKMTFDGSETIADLKEKIDAVIKENKGIQKVNKTDKIAERIMKGMPNFLAKGIVNFLKFIDKHGMLPKSVLEASPFHTSIFFVHLKSIKMPPVLHHIYDFGSTGVFVTMGEEKYQPVVVDRKTKEVQVKKILPAGIVIDERICDGLYNSLSLRLFKEILENPYVLDNPPAEVIQDVK